MSGVTHYGALGWAVCAPKRTGATVTANPAEVTCRKCIRLMERSSRPSEIEFCTDHAGACNDHSKCTCPYVMLLRVRRPKGPDVRVGTKRDEARGRSHRP